MEEDRANSFEQGASQIPAGVCAIHVQRGDLMPRAVLAALQWHAHMSNTRMQLSGIIEWYYRVEFLTRQLARRFERRWRWACPDRPGTLASMHRCSQPSARSKPAQLDCLGSGWDSDAGRHRRE
jgi:hypothetical protein